MARFNPSLLIFLRNLLFTEEELQICFIIKKGYKNERVNEAQALKSCSWSDSFPCPMSCFRSVSILRNYRYEIIQIVRAL